MFSSLKQNMIDSHAHLLKEFYQNIDELIYNLKKNNMLAIINVADSIETSKEILLYSEKYSDFLMPAIGIHPQNIKDSYLNDIEELDHMLKNNKVYAVGEIGLDYYNNAENKSIQKEAFIMQIELANKNNLPVIVHTRDAIQDTHDILKNNKCRGVIHCYSSSLEMAKEFIKLGFSLGIGGVLTFKNSNLYKVIEGVSIDSILIETDSPFLSPEPFRGKTNVPSNVLYVAKRIAEIKKINIEDVIDITSRNAIKLFDLPM